MLLIHSMGCRRPGKLLQDPSSTAIQLHHSSCVQNGRHSHHIREASFLPKSNIKLQMSPWSRGREDQRRNELSVCPSLNSRLQSLWEALRKECLWDPHAFLFEAHTLFTLPGLCHLTKVLLYEVAQFSLVLYQYIGLGFNSTRSCSSMTSFGQRDTYNVLMYHTRQTLLLANIYWDPPTQSTLFANIRAHYFGSRIANQSLY